MIVRATMSNLLDEQRILGNWNKSSNFVRFLAEAAVQLYYDHKSADADDPDPVLTSRDMKTAIEILEAVWVRTPVVHSFARIEEVVRRLRYRLSASVGLHGEIRDVVEAVEATFSLVRGIFNARVTSPHDYIMTDTGSIVARGAVRALSSIEWWPHLPEIEAEWRLVDLVGDVPVPPAVRAAFVTAWTIEAYEFAEQLAREATRT